MLVKFSVEIVNIFATLKNRVTITSLILLTCLFGCNTLSNDEKIPDSSGFDIPEGYELLWNDEFDDDGRPDSTRWLYEYGPNWYNGELQYYTKDRQENSRVENGNMIIEAWPEEYYERNYTSARLNSVIVWRYGRIDVRARLPKGNALWPAIWLYPVNNIYGGWPASGEIDIMENWSWDVNGIYGTIHTEAYNHIEGTQKGGMITVNQPWQNFFIYSLEWTPGTLKWVVDDSLFFEFNNEGTVETWPFDHPFRLILNVAVESSAPGEEDTWIKRTMEIDYVRVFQKSEGL